MPPRGPGIDQLSSLGWPFQFLGCYSCGRSWSRTWGRHRPCRAMHRTTANVCSVRRLKWAWHTACRQPTNGRYTAPRNEQTPRGAPTRRATVRVETDGETTTTPSLIAKPIARQSNRLPHSVAPAVQWSAKPSWNPSPRCSLPSSSASTTDFATALFAARRWSGSFATPGSARLASLRARERFRADADNGAREQTAWEATARWPRARAQVRRRLSSGGAWATTAGEAVGTAGITERSSVAAAAGARWAYISCVPRKKQISIAMRGCNLVFHFQAWRDGG